MFTNGPHAVPPEPFGDLGHCLRPLSGTRPQKNKNKIEYNLWKKKNQLYKLINFWGECKKKKKKKIPIALTL